MDPNKKTLRFYTYILFTAILPYCTALPFFPAEIGGFNMTGWAWLIMLAISIKTIAQGKPIMPYTFWIPWAVYILGYNLFSFSALGVQLSLQYLCFIVTGVAASTLYYPDEVLLVLFKRFKYFAIFVIVAGLGSSFLLGYTLYAQQLTMTAVLIACFCLSLYFIVKQKKPLMFYALLVTIPVYNVTRMPTLTILVIGILHFANTKITQKAMFLVIVALAGSFIFFLPSFQEKMFFSSSGTFTDLLSDDNDNINLNGRDKLKAIMYLGIEKSPVVGNGPRTDLAAFQDNNLELKEAHNDYLSVTYNYGYVGLTLLIFGFLSQFFTLYKIRKQLFNPLHKIICYTALTAFIGWGLLMYTDNILKYAVFWGNFHFCLIGMLYSMLRNDEYQRSYTALQ